MSSPLVLITGIIGFVSAHVLDSVLASPANYRIRGTLRSMSKKDELLSRLSPKDRGRVELVQVEDTATSDLLGAVRGVDYVLHVASPYQLQVNDLEKDLLLPAVEGTLNLLRFAKREHSIKRIIIISSFAAVTDLKAGGAARPGHVYTAEDWNPSTYEDAIAATGPSAGAFAYSASKKLAEEAAYDYVAHEDVTYKIASINPPMIYGPTLQPGVKRSNLNTSSNTIYNLISNAKEMPGDRLPLFCHVRDVADAHVLAIEKGDEAMNKRFLLCGGKFTWAHAVKHIAETYPDLKSRLPQGWENAEPVDVQSQIATLDTTPAEQILGIKFKDWKTTLNDCIDDLLKLEKTEGWNN